MKKENLYQSLLDKYTTECPYLYRSVVKNALLFICCLLVKETVNLNKLKNQLGSIIGKKGNVESHYRRLTRLFTNHIALQHLWKILLNIIAKQWLNSLKVHGEKYLLLDATTWELGNTKFHFLTLCILYKGISIPIFFVNLSKKGHSSCQERKRMFQMCKLIFNLKGYVLLADREYVGKEWFIFLTQEMGLDFVIRLSKSDYKKNLEEQKYSYDKLLAKARNGKIVEAFLEIEGYKFRWIALKNNKPDDPKDDLVILLSSLTRFKKNKIAQMYSQRWYIETMFKSLKSNGFNIEDMNLKDPNKVRLMMYLVIIAYIICVKEGIKDLKKISKKKFENKSTGEVSFVLSKAVFRKGYENVVYHAQKINEFVRFILKIINPQNQQFNSNISFVQ
ncbi:MAG: transposase [Emticicia sp.]|nr:transposase [Emticicia sp.]